MGHGAGVACGRKSGVADVSHDSLQLDALLENLSRAKNIEAAALLDVKDRQADEAKATERRQRAERAARNAAERVENARLAIRVRIEAQTDCDYDPQIPEDVDWGPEQDRT